MPLIPNLFCQVFVIVIKTIKSYWKINQFTMDFFFQINLGVIEANPSSTQGVIQILDILHSYIPERTEDEFFKIPVHGDGLSVERMRDAKAARAGSQTAAARLEGIEPVPQEFHKRGILMQVINKSCITDTCF